MFWLSGHEACGILAPQPGIEPSPPALEGKVLTTGPPGKSLHYLFLGQAKGLEFACVPYWYGTLLVRVLLGGAVQFLIPPPPPPWTEREPRGAPGP